MLEGKVWQITLVVRDQAAALKFYTEQVGMEKMTDFTPPGRNRWVTVAPKGSELEMALFQMGSAVDPKQKEWSQHWAPGKAPPIVLRVTDCRKTYRELSSRGVKFPQAPEDYPWGVAATFVDPDGNLFSIAEPPKKT